MDFLFNTSGDEGVKAVFFARAWNEKKKKKKRKKKKKKNGQKNGDEKKQTASIPKRSHSPSSGESYLIKHSACVERRWCQPALHACVWLRRESDNMNTSRGRRGDETVGAFRANKYVASADLRSSLEYSAFAGETKGGERNKGTDGMKDGRHHHSGWLLKRYSGDGPDVQWKRRWFYLLDDRL